MAQSARLSSIRIELRPYLLSQPVGVHWRPVETAREALKILIDSARSLGDFAIFFAIALLPWVVALGLVVFGIARFVRWRVRVSREKQAGNG